MAGLVYWYDFHQRPPFYIFGNVFNESILAAVSQAALAINQYVIPIALNQIGFYYIFYLGMLIAGASAVPSLD